MRAMRHAAVVACLERDGHAALLVSHLPNIRWLTGFTGSAGVLLVRPAGMTLITDFRYAAQAPEEVGLAAEVVIERSNVPDRLRRAIEAMAPETLAVESHVLTLREAERLTTGLRCRIVPTHDLVERFRQVKDESEVAAIRAAALLAQDALADILATVAAGDREIDVAARLESALRLRGSEWHPFPTIVASGPRAAMPHAKTSARELRRGEFLLIDFGAQVDGYCSDITRTVALGPADDRQRSVYDVVQQAQRSAREAIRAGMTGREADAIARDQITARGFGEAFGHSLGHGLGLEVHEGPRLAATAEALLPIGAVVTVEPGIYLQGWGGVRLEDDVWLGPAGPVLLSDGRTDLIELDI